MSGTRGRHNDYNESLGSRGQDWSSSNFKDDADADSIPTSFERDADDSLKTNFNFLQTIDLTKTNTRLWQHAALEKNEYIRRLFFGQRETQWKWAEVEAE